MIHIVFVLHDRTGEYCKNIGITLASIFENTKEKIVIHILHDETLTDGNKEKLILTCKQYQQESLFYQIEVNSAFNNERFTVGTFMKLYIPNALPSNVTKVIYLDSDLLVNLDIKQIWDKDFQGKSICVVKNWDSCSNELWICDVIETDRSLYFNAGVLLMDLGKIRRKYTLVEDAVVFFEKYPCANLADQDALNYIFYRDAVFIDEKYNFLAQITDNEVDENIYHFAGARKPWKGYWGAYSTMYWRYFTKTPWFHSNFIADLHKQVEQKFEWLEKFYRYANGRKIVLFGAGEVGEKLAVRLKLDKEKDYFVDNNQRKWSQRLNGFSVFSPEQLWQEDENDVVIVIALLSYSEIKKILDEKGYRENINFFDGRVFLEMEGGGNFFY